MRCEDIASNPDFRRLSSIEGLALDLRYASVHNFVGRNLYGSLDCGWLHRLVLHEAYVEDRPNQQVMQRYHLSESTFHRARRAAVAAVALDLSERGGAVARPGPDSRARAR